MFLAIGNDIFILLCFHVVVCLKFFLFSLLVIVDVRADIKATKQHLKEKKMILNKNLNKQGALSSIKPTSNIG